MFNSRLLFLLGLLCCHLSLFAQPNTAAFKATSITKILNQLEKTGDWVFNFDPTALADYTYTGQLNKGNITAQLTQLFYNTPYTFEQSGENILIYLESPKTYRICGTLKDKANQVPLPLANIYLDDQQQGTQSDDSGFFEVAITAYKHQEITISYIGYQSQSKMVQTFNSEACSDFLLEIDPALFGEAIIVKDYILSEITEGETYSGVKIDYQKLAQRQTIIDQDVLKTVQLIPGINSIDESATNLQIRGGTPDQNLILWENATLYDPGHLFGMIASINPYVVEEVQVFKGAFDPQYDNRVGGIVDLSLNDSIKHSFHGGVGSTLTEGHAYFQAPLVQNKLSLLLSGRNSTNQLFNSPTLQNYSTKVFQGSKVEDQKEEIAEGEVDANQQLDFYDLNAKLIFQPTDKFMVKTSWFKTHNTFNYQAELFEDKLATVDNVLFDVEALSLTGSLKLRPNWQIELALLHSTYSNDYLLTQTELEEAEPEEILRNNVFNDISDRGVVLTNYWRLRPSLAVKAGYDYNEKAVNLNVDVTATYEESFTEDNFAKGRFHNAFAAFDYQQQQLQLNGGLRATYFVETGHLGLSPRFNVQYALSDKLKLKFSGGILQQYISQLKQFGENALDLNTQVWVLNNQEETEDGKVNNLQTANKIALGFVYHQKGWLIDVEGYYNQTDGLSTLGPSFGTSAAANEIVDFWTGTSKASGIDFLIKKHWRGYQTWLNYSISKINFNFPALFDFYFRASNEQRHTLSFINSYTHKNWQFSLSYQYKTGLPYTNALGVTSVVDQEDFEETGDLEESTYYLIEYDTPNAQRLPNYSRLDAGISYRPTFKNTNLKAELTISMINLLNRTNTFRRDFDSNELENEVGEVIGQQVIGIDKRLLRRTPLISARVYW